jgi:Ser/Thr protein kinase RdoA (MazF antagonist)
VTAWNGSTDRNWTALGESVAANVTAETVGTETVDGAESYVVRLSHDDERVDGNLTLWVDTEAYSVHKVRASDGTNRTVFDFDDQRFNVSVYDTEFQPPGDAEAVGRFSRASYDTFDAAQANTSLALRALDGATFERAVVTTQAGRTVAVQSYADGNRSVAVIATAESLPLALDNGTDVTVAGRDATYVEFGDRAAVVWETDGVTRAVVADLSQAALVDVAERAVG